MAMVALLIVMMVKMVLVLVLVLVYKETMKCDGYKSKMDRC